MEFLKFYLDFVMHLDVHLNEIIQSWGMWTYLLLFLIIFCETGLVVTPILPGDSLLFAVGTFAALGSLNLKWTIILLSVAAILGDTINYWIGAILGPKVFNYENSKIFRKEYIDKTHQYYEKYGGLTIILARFIPIIRTFAPFVAGIGKMSYFKFFSYNVIGGIGWIILLVLSGYFFGNIPIIKKNFTIVIMAIIVISILPGITEFIRHKYLKK